MKNSQKIAALGVSRGLGREFVLQWNQQIPEDTFFLSSRKEQDLQSLKASLSAQDHRVRPCDYANKDLRSDFLKDLEGFQPDRIFYFAGGGPYGLFGEKKMQAHEWAYEVNFLFPSALLHWSLNVSPVPMQIVFIGSAIAENLPDHSAAAYSASKHALRGLISTVQVEYSQFDLRLFSPGYMDTSMLPVSAAPRSVPGLVLSVEASAAALISWVHNVHDASRQLLYTKHESNSSC